MKFPGFAICLGVPACAPRCEVLVLDGGRIDTVRVAGRPIDDAASCTVVINDFMAAGGGAR